MEQIEAPASWRTPPAHGYSLFLSLPRQRPTLQTMNVLNGLPKSIQAKAKQALHAIWQAETKADAEKAFALFLETYEPKYPKATVCRKCANLSWKLKRLQTLWFDGIGRNNIKPVRERSRDEESVTFGEETQEEASTG